MKKTNLPNLEYFAKQFFSLTTDEQDAWTQKRLGVSARTFRRWCILGNIKKVKKGNVVEITSQVTIR